MEALSKILILAWHVQAKADLPCADFLCPEGQRGKIIAAAVVFSTQVVIEKLLSYFNPFVAKTLKLCNDVESNPGPAGSPRKPRNRSNSRKRGQNKPRSRAASEDESDASEVKAGQRGPGGNRRRGTRDGSSVREGGAGIGSLVGRHDVLEERVNQMEDQIASSKTQSEAGNKVLDHLVTKVNTIDGSVNNHENGLVSENIRLKDEVTYLIKTCKNYEDRFVEMETEVQSVKNQMNELVCVYDDLQDRLYEIDRSWQNNLVFQGIKPDPGGVHESMDCLESKIKGVLRTNLNIGREIPIVRLQRIFNGSDVRGYKPVVVNFQKWSDKEDVLRKAKILKTSGIYVEEDFSRAAKFRRKELEKFAKEVKALSSDKKCIFKHDKLIIDDHVYIFNEQEHRIERLPSSLSPGSLDVGEEVGDAVSLARRIRQKQSVSYTQTNFNVNAKRAQSVESMLDRIPNVGIHHGGISPHSELGMANNSFSPKIGQDRLEPIIGVSHVSKQGNTHHGMSSSISSYTVNGTMGNTGNITGGGNGYQSSPERKSSKQNNSIRAVNSEQENDTDMEIENGGSTNDVN